VQVVVVDQVELLVAQLLQQAELVALALLVEF
jgi:hypothetical protein